MASTEKASVCRALPVFDGIHDCQETGARVVDMLNSLMRYLAPVPGVRDKIATLRDHAREMQDRTGQRSDLSRERIRNIGASQMKSCPPTEP